MIFLLFVTIFVACSCVIVPLVAFGVFAAMDRKGNARGGKDGARLSFLPTDSVR